MCSQMCGFSFLPLYVLLMIQLWIQEQAEEPHSGTLRNKDNCGINYSLTGTDDLSGTLPVVA